MNEKEFFAVEKVSFKDLLKWRVKRILKKKNLSFRVPHIEKIKIEFLGSDRQVTAVTWIGHAIF